MATFESFPCVETVGMTLITIGPIFNTIAANLFIARNDPLLLFNKAWRTSEAIEFTGMVTLCISYIDMGDLMVFFVELVGFLCLCCAATMEFQYFPTTPIPHVEVRWDLVHSSECIGLMMLIVVAFAQYRMRIHKALQEEEQEQSAASGSGATADHTSDDDNHKQQYHHRHQVDRDEHYSMSHFPTDSIGYRVETQHDDGQRKRPGSRGSKADIMMV